MFSILFFTIFISLITIYFTRNSKYKKVIWSFWGLITLILVIFAIWFVSAQFQTNEFKTLTCGSEKFYYAGSKNAEGEYAGYISKNGDKYDLLETSIGNLVKKNNSYTALYNLPPDLDKTKEFAQLLNCKEFDLNAMYQPYQPANPDNLSEIRDKDRCYLLNRTGEKDYPDCSPEIKAKFEVK